MAAGPQPDPSPAPQPAPPADPAPLPPQPGPRWRNDPTIIGSIVGGFIAAVSTLAAAILAEVTNEIGLAKTLAAIAILSGIAIVAMITPRQRRAVVALLAVLTVASAAYLTFAVTERGRTKATGIASTKPDDGTIRPRILSPSRGSNAGQCPVVAGVLPTTSADEAYFLAVRGVPDGLPYLIDKIVVTADLAPGWNHGPTGLGGFHQTGQQFELLLLHARGAKVAEFATQIKVDRRYIEMTEETEIADKVRVTQTATPACSGT